MKASKLVLGMGTLVLAALPAHAQMVGTGTPHQAVKVQMAMVAPVLGGKHTPKFETLNVNQFPTHQAKPVTMNVFPTAKQAASAHLQLTMGSFTAPNYTAPSVRFQVTPGTFPLPNYVGPSVKTQVTAAGFAAPNFVAPSVKFQVTDGGFAAPVHVSPAMSLQIASAEFPLPVHAGGPAEWSK
jgi:hypothetical protein